ncbi:MAG TPA: MarR family transcriptional regulator [Acidimicrobiales bacterium]|nr:MarR family transcriptional regulator [Acidimicrobiales bacterium]
MARRPLGFDPIAEARRQWAAHGWEEVADGMAAVTSIFRAQQIFLARIDEALRPFGLTFARYEVLMLLTFSRTGALPLSKVGSRLQVHPTSVTNAVDRLEAQGLLRRSPHPSDRRTTLAELLPAGRELALAATETVNAAVFADPHLDGQDTATLVEVLGRLRHAAGDFDGATAAASVPKADSSSPDGAREVDSAVNPDDGLSSRPGSSHQGRVSPATTPGRGQSGASSHGGGRRAL